LEKYSKENCLRIVAWVGNDQKRFDALFKMFVSNEYRLAQQSAWPLSYCVEAYPDLIKKHFATLIQNLNKPQQHNAIKRNTIRILQFVAIPKKYQGSIMNICFDFIQDIQEKPAVKAFALTVLENLSKQYPEITAELCLIIEEQMPHETAAFISRGKKILTRNKASK
jgi:hypothetical protein